MNDHYETPGGFDSRDCVDVFYDGVGDTTVRPIPEHLRAFVVAEREKLIRWQKEYGLPPNQHANP